MPSEGDVLDLDVVAGAEIVSQIHLCFAAVAGVEEQSALLLLQRDAELLELCHDAGELRQDGFELLLLRNVVAYLVFHLSSRESEVGA